MKNNSIMANPGSPAAVAAGCSCAVMDNHNGEGIWYGDEQVFWINGSCKIHGDSSYLEEDDVSEV